MRQKRAILVIVSRSCVFQRKKLSLLLAFVSLGLPRTTIVPSLLPHCGQWTWLRTKPKEMTVKAIIDQDYRTTNQNSICCIGLEKRDDKHKGIEGRGMADISWILQASHLLVALKNATSKINGCFCMLVAFCILTSEIRMPSWLSVWLWTHADKSNKETSLENEWIWPWLLAYI